MSRRPWPARSRGFTLIEVMVALFILALLTLSVSQGLQMRTRIALVEQERLPLLLCARSLAGEFATTRFWPDTGEHQGESPLGCHWRLEVEETGIPALRRGRLDVSRQKASPPTISFTLFLGP
ncbi:prepilin-type N-terminal cleavage/methylation domain-containing protein [Halomonas sp. TRM85114]|uniref:prepilin-type N-terminal cleavage/methylation domain-containing protein n=1 Tax=Halomonas jincaotanensis TaxID=2810616 RepID=UPI001BD67FE8|nr:prepilin-type N-terminal cleavage/methylation domain-containing protein [Halomonas jincaotanensis]MBS9403128.1 prepilin-type N-terminal cleavage/methylation domain-containing protein [Halomonas jincaotanensis]